MQLYLDIGETHTTAIGEFEPYGNKVTQELEGRKFWKSPQRLVFETTPHNLRVFKETFPRAIYEARGAVDISPMEQEEVWPFRMQPRRWQEEGFVRFKDMPGFAIFSEPGTGKTKLFIDIMCYRHAKGHVTGTLILSSPKGVHAQWVKDQLPKHMWHQTQYEPHIWGEDAIPKWIDTQGNALRVFSANIDILTGEKGRAVLHRFADAHREKLMICVDEGDSIKNIASVRSKNLIGYKQIPGIAQYTQQRVVMTGTPIAKDLTDEFGEFYFINWKIIGHKYKTSFMAQFCKMGGWEGRQVIGHRNVELFKQITAPYIIRATKKELDLPEKNYNPVAFDMSAEQKRIFADMRLQYEAELADGNTVSAKNAIVAMLRMQQVSCGFAQKADGGVTLLADNPRLGALRELRGRIPGKVIIWCRFIEDTAIIKRSMPNAVVHVGESSDVQRELAKHNFINKLEITDLIATTGSMGRGVDGLQSVCSDAIFYSNSFNAIDRWQAEDRIHRLGMGDDPATYHDLIARGSPDRKILANLKRKKSLSDWVLDDFKMAFDESDEL